MESKVWNFSAGPAVLPDSVKREMAQACLELPGTGRSILEISHRAPEFEAVLNEAKGNISKLLGLRDTHEVLFMQGGATAQFNLAPRNLAARTPSKKKGYCEDAAYVVTGAWSQKASKAAAEHENFNVADIWDGEDSGFRMVPSNGLIKIRAVADDEDYTFAHVTSNETIHGVQFQQLPDIPGIPLVVDASSDFLSRLIPDIENCVVVYAGAQKNVGPAGVTIVLVRKDVLEKDINEGEELPEGEDYSVQAKNNSLYNTPPVGAIYGVTLTTRWLLNEVGGLIKMEAQNEAKAAEIYKAIDESAGFYSGHAQTGSRSKMNVTFRLPSEELEKKFVTEAKLRGLIELKGHRSVGGIRVSLYNAMPMEGAQAAAQFMEDFRRKAA